MLLRAALPLAAALTLPLLGGCHFHYARVHHVPPPPVASVTVIEHGYAPAPVLVYRRHACYSSHYGSYHGRVHHHHGQRPPVIVHHAPVNCH